MNLIETPAVELVPRLQDRSLKVETLAAAYVERINRREPITRAFVHFDADAVMAAARGLDAGPIRGPLHGIPIGIKDIMDTHDMPTRRGSPIYAKRQPLSDAACVAQLRAAGALVMGKTVTTEFAYFHPGPTTNPHNAAHTPGGSSSGSAAAVADFMVPFALGTQTAASVIRPSSFCGVVGFKSAHGSFPLAGVMPLAHSLDSLGWMSRTVADSEFLYDVMTGSAADPAPEAAWRPRIGLCRTPMWPKAHADVAAAMDRAAAALGKAGWSVTEVDLGAVFADLAAAQQCVMAHEAARTFVDECRRHPEQVSRQFTALATDGTAIEFSAYRAALSAATAARQALGTVLADFDALLAPSAAGEAPEGLDVTGDPVFSRMWTLIGVPSLNLPVGRGTRGLPIGLQFIVAAGAERRLFTVARAAEAVLAAR